MGIYNASRLRYTASQNVAVLSIIPTEAMILKRSFALTFFMFLIIYCLVVARNLSGIGLQVGLLGH